MERIKEFYCDENLSQYTDSMLFDSVTNIAHMNFKDKDYEIDLWLDIRGESQLDYKGETYCSASDYPEELVALIKNDKGNWMYSHPEELYVSLNNWFEYIYTVKDETGEELYCDGIMYEDSISSKTFEQLKKEMLEMCEIIYENKNEKYF